MKRPGKTVARRETDIPKFGSGELTYLFVLAAGGAFVSAGFEVSDAWLQPVSTAPITIPNSTISVYILFIVNLTFTKSLKRTSTIFPRILAWAQLTLSIGSGAGDCAPAPSHTTVRAVFRIRRLVRSEYFLPGHAGGWPQNTPTGWAPSAFGPPLASPG